MNLPITSVPGTDLSVLLQPQGPRRQPMRGFDDEFVDIVDYIVRITHRIWEERHVHKIYDYYSANCVVHGTRGDSVGAENVVSGTVQTLHTFPDRRLIADDVIWGGDDNVGFYSSHRISSTGTHAGWGSYGPPTHKALRWKVIADCICLENKIVEEWLVRDELHIAQQLGVDVPALVQSIAATLPATLADEARTLLHQLHQDMPPKLMPTQSNEIEQFVRASLHNLWNCRKLSEIYERYVYNYECRSASSRMLFGHDAYMRFVTDWLSTFPDGKMSVDHFCAVQNADGSWRTAVRWRFVGTHSAIGIYGPPTGRTVSVLGITHHTVRHGRFVEEWTVFDELALMAQLVHGA
jgi:predicted ester cyclase